MTQKENKGAPLKEGLITAMKALDNQVAREMQRTPAEEGVLGVQKWGPYQKRVEDVTTLIIDEIGDRTITLDSVLILAQAFAKSLQLLVSELGQDGLGVVRTQYCQAAMEAVSTDAERALGLLREERTVN